MTGTIDRMFLRENSRISRNDCKMCTAESEVSGEIKGEERDRESGSWDEPPAVTVGHGVNPTELHCRSWQEPLVANN